MNYWKMTFATMASQSAMLTGFTWGELSIQPSKGVSQAVGLCYLLFTSITMASGLVVIIIGSLCSMLGPGLALRGPDGALSVHKAVDCMKRESQLCFNFFLTQLFFFHLSSFMLMWMLYSTKTCIVINIVLFVFLLAFIIQAFDIIHKL